MLLACYGGMFDGGTVSTSLKDEFLWTNGDRCWRAKRKGTELYRRAVDTTGETVLLFAQYAYALCEDCGVYHSRLVSKCGLCGAPLVSV